MELKWIRVEDGRPQHEDAVLGYDKVTNAYYICYFYIDGGIMVGAKCSQEVTISHWAHIMSPADRVMQ